MSDAIEQAMARLWEQVKPDLTKEWFVANGVEYNRPPDALVVDVAANQIRRMKSALWNHNTDCDQQCEALRISGRCDPYRSRDRRCPDCPRHERINEPPPSEEEQP